MLNAIFIISFNIKLYLNFILFNIRNSIFIIAVPPNNNKGVKIIIFFKG